MRTELRRDPQCVFLSCGQPEREKNGFVLLGKELGQSHFPEKHRGLASKAHSDKPRKMDMSQKNEVN